MSVTHKGKISKILAIDFNVRRITPIIHESNGVTRLGLLVSGAGCSGCGVRFVNFDGVTPTSTPVMTTDESKGLYDSWLRGKDPLGVEDIWERLEKIGVKVDQKRTMMAVEALVRF